MIDPHLFSKRVFFWSGIYGIAVMLPQYAMERQIGDQFPPPITHPEYFYGFIGIVLAWQLAFITISRDPVRFRPLMLAAIVEKVAFAGPALGLILAARVAPATAVFAVIDLTLGALFLLCYRRCAEGHRRWLPEVSASIRPGAR